MSIGAQPRNTLPGNGTSTIALKEPGGIAGGGSSVRGAGASWTPSTTIGGSELPPNRAHRRAEEKRARQTHSSQVRVKLTPAEKKERMLAQIRKETGAAPPVQDDEVALSGLGEWGEWGVKSLQGGVQLFKDAVQWMGSGGLPGAAAAETCDVDGTCDGKEVASSLHMTISDFKKTAAAKFTMELSPSLAARKDQTLRGVVVLVADKHHEDPGMQADLTSLVWGSIHSDDRLLVEQPLGCENSASCRNVHVLGAKCHPIDISHARSESDKAIEKYEVAMARLVHFVLGRTLDLGNQRKPSVEELARMGKTRLEALVQEHIKNVRSRNGPSMFSAQETEALKELHVAENAAGKELRTSLDKNSPLREATFRDEIERHAAEAADQAIFVILGSKHVDKMKAELLRSKDSIVLYPKRKFS